MITEGSKRRQDLRELIEDLAGYRSDSVFNPWGERCPGQDIHRLSGGRS